MRESVLCHCDETRETCGHATCQFGVPNVPHLHRLGNDEFLKPDRTGSTQQRSGTPTMCATASAAFRNLMGANQCSNGRSDLLWQRRSRLDDGPQIGVFFGGFGKQYGKTRSAVSASYW